jgi:hypothetical protein
VTVYQISARNGFGGFGAGGTDPTIVFDDLFNSLQLLSSTPANGWDCSIEGSGLGQRVRCTKNSNLIPAAFELVGQLSRLWP